VAVGYPMDLVSPRDSSGKGNHVPSTPLMTATLAILLVVPQPFVPTFAESSQAPPTCGGLLATIVGTSVEALRIPDGHWTVQGTDADGRRRPGLRGRAALTYTLRSTAVTMPRMLAWVPSMGSYDGLWGSSQTWPSLRWNVLTVASPSMSAATMSPFSAVCS
jgi:hypothetical protein